jgi:hypothetical protein
VAQVLVMLVVYAAAWAALRRRQAAEPWMGVALLAFCMTTLWPVWYIFLDVFVFGAACVLVRAAPALYGRLRLAWGTALVCALGLTAVAA